MANSENNKRIAKNTLMLYVRMGVSMLVSLYTSRIILATLGIEDYGIFSIVAGLITMFTFMNGALSSSTSRFLTFELGRNDSQQLRKVFSASFTSHFILALLILVLCETVGLWFFKNKLVIPEQRMGAAFWVYQFSIMTTIVGIIQVPYGAIIIAREKMNIYAYMSIFDVVIKLMLVYSLQWFGGDKLVFWSMCLLLVSLLYACFYVIYCIKNFPESHIRIYREKELYKNLFFFSGWSMFGRFASLGAYQVVDVFINMFYGVVLNAAVGLSNQVSGAINSFVSNFQTAFSPQIIKTYASGDNQASFKLIFRTSKFSYYLLFIIALPVFLNIGFILTMWLTEVPGHTETFVSLILVCMLIEALSAPLWIAAQAIGDIRNYSLLVSFVVALNCPISYLVLKSGLTIELVFVVRIMTYLASHFTRIFYLRKKINFPAIKYIKEVTLTSVIISLISIPIPYWISKQMDENWMSLFISSAVAMFVSVNVIYWIGLNLLEKKFVRENTYKMIKRILK